MAKQEISINVSILGSLNYKGVNAFGHNGPNKNAFIAGLNPQDEVEWKCNKDFFIIDFGSHSPFPKLRYLGSKKYPICATVRNLTELEQGPYKYSVTVFNSMGKKTRYDDPVLIIPPEREG